MENATDDNSSTEETVTPICHNDYCLPDQDYIDMVKEHIQPTSAEWVLVAVFVVLFIVGLVGNFLVCYAVIKNSQMRTVTNLFIMNLAIADLMVILICLPPTLLVDVSETWFFGEVMCKIFLYFQVNHYPFNFFLFTPWHTHKHTHTHTHTHIYIYIYIYVNVYIYIYIYESKSIFPQKSLKHYLFNSFTCFQFFVFFRKKKKKQQIILKRM